MKSKDLISIVIPAYNSERTIVRCLESIFNQSYRPIEVIVINDGSSDKTAEIVNHYKSNKQSSSFYINLVNKPNNGAASCISVGLQLIKGSFFATIDSDDYLNEKCIETKINYLLCHPKCDMLLSNVIVLDKNLKVITGYENIGWAKHDGKEFFFDLLLDSNMAYKLSNFAIIRTSHLFKMIPKKKIIESREGQNFQIMLPASYKANVECINLPLMTIVASNNSHSKKRRSLKKAINRINNIEALICGIMLDIPSLSIAELENLKNQLHIKYLKEKCSLYYYYKKRKQILSTYDELVLLKGNTANEDTLYKNAKSKVFPLNLIIRKIFKL